MVNFERKTVQGMFGSNFMQRVVMSYRQGRLPRRGDCKPNLWGDTELAGVELRHEVG